MRYGKATLTLSAVLVVLSLISLGVRGLNLGIDFTGGTLLERQLGRPVTADDVRQVLASPQLADLDVAGAVIQPLDDPHDVLIRTRPLSSQEIERVDAALGDAFGSVEILRTELVGPVVGAELVRRALLAVALASLGILVYVSLRFEFKFAVAAIAALLHDAIIATGVVSALGVEVNSPFIAAILTVIGYSLNATIVIFDRVRENLRIRKGESLFDLLNRSLNETLARTIHTSATTLLALVTLFIFGGSTLRDFILVLLVGLTVGTYSSMMVANPLWWLWKEREERRRAEASPAPVR
ncbi:MAG: protein translocase subunit SecF [Bacillota bacterium]|nr:protein translocase subunit SecF [Bacillota bacterium]REJ37202.1 MAG: protein translocase subunit SecF [Bacillota bacterium]